MCTLSHSVCQISVRNYLKLDNCYNAMAQHAFESSDNILVTLYSLLDGSHKPVFISINKLDSTELAGFIYFNQKNNLKDVYCPVLM